MRFFSSLRAALAALCLVGCSERTSERPSLILVSIDTLRADHVGLYGYERDTTPNLDRWAKDALVFERAFTTAAWTLVAHMTMLTGLFPAQHGVIGQNRALSPEIPLVAERLRAAGYRTYALHEEGGWIDERHGFERGFDLFRGHTGLAQADQHLRELLPELEKGGPFFLFLHTFDVHCGDLSKAKSPYEAPEPYQSMFLKGLQPLPDVPLRELWESGDLLTPAQLETLIAQYDGGIRHVDEQLGQWLDELARRGLASDALVIVTADHGDALGEHGKLNHHGDSWQSALHVPLVVRPPGGLAGGKRVATPVHLGDVVPTLLDAAGLEDELLPGASLLGSVPESRVIYGIKLPEAFVVKWPEKLVASPRDQFRATDLERDPVELSPTPGEGRRFHELKDEALHPGHPVPAPIQIEELDPEVKARLDALGYGGETASKEEKEKK
jgi:arylsulfatase A-like enzyme